MSLELNRDTVRKIHYQTSVVDGRKNFGDLDGLVETGSKVTQQSFNPGNPELSVVVATMDRPDKFRKTLDSLVNSMAQVGSVVRLIVMDNSINPEKAHERVTSIPTNVESIIHYHDARMIQATARNKAVAEVVGASQKIAIWDGDIYSSGNTFLALSNTLDENCGIDAVAPVMIGINNDDYSQEVELYGDIGINSATRRKTHMPGEIGEEIWVRENDLMRSTMMRGAFMLRRRAIDKIATHNPEHLPWLKDFVVWQNVPFFLSLRELGLDMAYILDNKAIVAHDDRIDPLSVGASLPWRSNETLKSLTILMSRNALFNSDVRARNMNRFLSYNIPVIARAMSVDYPKAEEIQDIMINIAKSFSENPTADGFIANAKGLLEKVDLRLHGNLNWVINELSRENTFSRIKQTISLNPSRRIYSVDGVN